MSTHVTIREVALRDGLQIENPIPLSAKLELLEAIVATGVREIEATAFVSPSKVPALADAAALAAELPRFEGVEFSALVAGPGGAGGVGSILIQLARRLTGLTVVATATRPESQQWCRDLGAHAVIDHGKPMKEQIEALKLPPVALVASLTFTDQHYKAIAEIMAPQGKFGLIDDPPEFTMSVFKGKAISVHWESMFTRPIHQTADLVEQHRLLNEVAGLVEAGKIRSTLTNRRGPINAATLREVHALVESGRSIGKTVVEGW